MKQIVAERTAGHYITRPLPKVAARRVPLLSGTMNFVDCLVALRYLLDPRQLVQGPGLDEYEHAFARHVGVRYAYSFCHGRVGLYSLLRGLDVGPGHEVLLQVPTHIVVSNAVRYTGARPVYVDCSLDTYNMDLEQAERRITPRTKALVLQHTFGSPMDLDAALDLTRRHGLDLIEDCVHALGATYDGRPVGSFGRAAFFSTEETKTISSTMGGMVTTDDPALATRVREFQQSCSLPPIKLSASYILKLVLYHGLMEPHVHQLSRVIYECFGKRNPLPQATTNEEIHGVRPATYTLRLSNAQAVLALRQLRRLGANVAHRRSIASAFHKRLSEEGFKVPHYPAKADPAFVRYPVWVTNPALTVRVAARYVTLGRWFTSVLEESASPAYGAYEMGSCPRAEDLASHLVNLPTNPRMNARDVETIISALARAEAMAAH